jgi:hypothetical protein
MQTIFDLLEEDARARATSTPSPTKCYGDYVRERAAAEGKIGYRRKVPRSGSMDRLRAAGHASEVDRIAAWIKNDSAGWPLVVKSTWLLDTMPDDLIEDGSTIDRARVVTARALKAAGWTKVYGPGGTAEWSAHWTRIADAPRLDALPGRERTQVFREAESRWGKRATPKT